jgi:hypothetical protein
MTHTIQTIAMSYTANAVMRQAVANCVLQCAAVVGQFVVRASEHNITVRITAASTGSTATATATLCLSVCTLLVQ